MPSNAGLRDRLAELSPERRAAVEKLLASRGAAPPTEKHIPRRSPGEECPLSPAELRLWFLHRIEPENPWYNVSLAVRIRGELQSETLRHALHRLAQRHEMLRTTYPSEGGLPRRWIADESTIDFSTLDLSSLPDHDRDAGIERLLRTEARRGFNLQIGPLFRFVLIHLAPRHHVFQISAHHIVADGLSVQILLRELAALGIAAHAGMPAALPDLPIQYADFALSEKDAQRPQDLAYWKSKLHDAPPLLALPADRPRPAVQTFEGRRLDFAIAGDRFQRLRALSRTAGATPFATLLAAYATLLYRYSGSTDIVIGTPVAGRTHPDLENLIGCFVNTLVLRLDCSGNPTFLHLLDRARKTTQEALAHQDLPFEKLVEELRPLRTRSYGPLFQVMFNLQRSPRERIPGIDVTPIPIRTETTVFDLSLSLVESENDLSGYIEYSTTLFDDSTVVRMAAHFQTLIDSILHNPNRKLSEIPILTPAERRQLLQDFNPAARAWPPELTPSLLEAQAGRTPDAVAVLSDGPPLTYRELNRQANRLAHRLRELGAGPGSFVGVLMDQSPDVPVALLAILKAGAAYVPIDPAYPPERLQFMIEDACLSLLIAARDLADRVPPGPIRTLLLPTEDDRLSQNFDNPPPVAAPDDPAYLLYTCGSTGRPKGVLLPHRALANFLRWMQDEYPISSADAVLQRTSISFDISLWELLAPLLSGARLVIPGPDDRDLRQLPDLIRKHRVTVVQFVPSLLRALLDAASLSNCESLRRVFCAGEPLAADLVRKLAGQLSAAEIVNGYGPTETCIYSTSHRCSPDDRHANALIGRPVANTRLYVLDEHLEPVPVGVPGELYIGGAGVALGYLNRPDLTAERFVPNPFGAPDLPLYRTGDLVRYHPDGALEFLGRTDHQVKIRGYRIELEEVESALLRSPGVANTVAAVRETSAGERRLVAYIVRGGETPLLPDDLRRFLKQHLPEFMVPGQFIFLEALPLAPNGKVNRRALPDPEGRGAGAPATYVPPADALEARIARLWEQLLEVQPVGRRDNFFELGGHSLLALRLFAGLEREFGSSIPAAALFEAPTVEQLAAILRAGSWKPRHTSLLPIQPNGRKTPLFLVHADSGHVFFYQDLAFRLGQDQPVYGFESSGLDGLSEPLTTIEEMAAHYIQEMRDVQPHGPYFLGGFCFGAYIALEMAHQLEAMGESVPLLISLNTDGGWKTVQSLVDAARLHRRYVSGLTGPEKIAYFAERTFYRLFRMGGALWRARAGWYRARKQPVPANLRHSIIGELNFQAVRNYIPRPSKAALLYFQGTGDRTRSAEPFWGPITSRVETYLVPGHGVEVLREPGAQRIAEKLQSRLADPTP